MSPQSAAQERLVTVATHEPGRIVYRVVPASTPSTSCPSSVPVSAPTVEPKPEHDGPIPIVIYTPSQLFVDGDPARGFRPRTTGTSGTTTWAGLIRLLSRAPEGNPEKYADPSVQKSARGGWSACALREGRRLGTAFIETRLLGLDIDKNGDIEKAIKAFAPFKKIVHSTYKSTDSAPRCRVVLLLKGSCRDAHQFRLAHRAVRQAVVRAGWFKAEDFDDAGSDPSRLWFLPMVPPGATFVFHATGGELLDLSKLPVETAPKTNSKFTKTTKTSTSTSAALAWADRNMAGASEGHRHTKAFSLAAWLAEIQPPIDDADIHAALVAHAPQGREHEFCRTVADGIERGRAAR